jgi:2-hydroxy-6-oxonona-2,4-dienedioate hydrolase
MRWKSLASILLVTTFGVSAVVWYPYRAEMRRVRATVRLDASVATTKAGPIEYAEKRSGIPLFSIHGAGGGFDQGLANAEDLVGDVYRIIAPSRFGYLGTPIPTDSSPVAQADAHAALLRHLSVDKAIVLGVSAGARSAIELTLRYPERVAALILIVPATYAPESPVTIEPSRANRFAFWLVNAGADFTWWATEKIAPDVLTRFIGVPPEVVATAAKADQDRVIRIVRNMQPLSRRFPGINIDSNPTLTRLPLEEVRSPTLIISSRDDLFNTLPAAKYTATAIPNAKLIVYETGGHLLVGRDREVRTSIAEFLALVGVNPREGQARPCERSTKATRRTRRRSLQDP